MKRSIKHAASQARSLSPSRELACEGRGRPGAGNGPPARPNGRALAAPLTGAPTRTNAGRQARGVMNENAIRSVDRVALATLHEAVCEARDRGDKRPTFTLIVGYFQELGAPIPQRPMHAVDLGHARDEWLSRLRSSGRSQSCLSAYRVALDDLLAYLDRSGAVPWEETIVAYLDDYRRRRQPANATYSRASRCSGTSSGG
jgi:hypothetical protein